MDTLFVVLIFVAYLLIGGVVNGAVSDEYDCLVVFFWPLLLIGLIAFGCAKVAFKFGQLIGGLFR